MTEFDDIKNLSLPETRDAAKQLLDSVAGDLTGEAAQRFQALTRHAEELRAEQRRRGREAEEALRRYRAGELRVVPGAPTGGDDGDAPPGNSLRDTAFRTLDSCVRDGLMSSRAAETAETLCRTGPPQSTSWAQRWLAAPAAATIWARSSSGFPILLRGTRFGPTGKRPRGVRLPRWPPSSERWAWWTPKAGF